MKQEKKRVGLLITVALKAEIPYSWLKNKINIYTLKQLSAEGPGIIKSGICLLVTGVGLEASRAAAVWAKENLCVDHVVNIGTVGALGNSANVGDWIVPEEVVDENGVRLKSDMRMPFPLPTGLAVFRGGCLVSVKKPQLGTVPTSWLGYQFVDMEAFAQAEIFQNTETSFHILKFVSDFSNHQAKAQFQANLARLKKSLRSLFAFLSEVTTPEITVVIPVYNRQDRIGECLNSVLGQTLKPLEVIVVDDASKDQTQDILTLYKNQITLITLDKNSGVSHARNVGTEASTTDWIAFLDSDDTWTADKLEKQWQFLADNPFYEIVQPEEIWIRGGVRVNACKHHKKHGGWIWETSLQRCMITPSGVLLKKSLLQKYGGFDETFRACEDYDLWLKISRHHPVGLDPALSVIKYGGHADQLSRRYPAMDKFRVKSLMTAYEQETEPSYKQRLKEILIKKLTILINGAQKRDKTAEALLYKKNLDALG